MHLALLASPSTAWMACNACGGEVRTQLQHALAFALSQPLPSRAGRRQPRPSTPFPARHSATASTRHGAALVLSARPPSVAEAADGSVNATEDAAWQSRSPSALENAAWRLEAVVRAIWLEFYTTDSIRPRAPALFDFVAAALAARSSGLADSSGVAAAVEGVLRQRARAFTLPDPRGDPRDDLELFRFWARGRALDVYGWDVQHVPRWVEIVYEAADAAADAGAGAVSAGVVSSRRRGTPIAAEGTPTAGDYGTDKADDAVAASAASASSRLASSMAVAALRRAARNDSREGSAAAAAAGSAAAAGTSTSETMATASASAATAVAAAAVAAQPSSESGRKRRDAGYEDAAVDVESVAGIVALAAAGLRDGLRPEAVALERHIRSHNFGDPILRQATPPPDDDYGDGYGDGGGYGGGGGYDVAPPTVAEEVDPAALLQFKTAEEEAAAERQAKRMLHARRRAVADVFLACAALSAAATADGGASADS